MTTSPTPPSDADPEAPLAGFSQCHAGILGQLEALAGLPALLVAAAQARRIAADSVGLFREVVYEHHQEEERELFPAVLASAAPGNELDHVQAVVDRLTREHRLVEAAWERLEKGMRNAAKGRDSDLRGEDLSALVQAYEAHARYEEREFLPLSERILGRNSNHMAALGLSLHLRHALPEVLARFGSRI